MKSSTPSKTPVVHHRVRTFFAGLFGTITLVLILCSFLVVWVNRTLTDTPTFLTTVSPVVKEKAVQTFIGDKINSQLKEDVAVSEAAKFLLPAEQISGKSIAELTPIVRTAIIDNIQQTMSSPGFVKLWNDTLTSAHTQLIAQLKSGSPTITLNLRPAMVEAVAELKNTKLSDMADKIGIPEGAGVLNLKGGSIDKVHKYYAWLQQGTVALVVLIVLLTGLTVWISVHHAKTMRRMLVGTATIALVLAVILQAPSIVPLQGSDQVTIDAAKAFAHVLFHNLQLTCLAVAVGGYALATGSKLYERSRKA